MTVVVVAVETSSRAAGVAVVDDGTLLAETSVRLGSTYAEQLPVMLDRALADAHTGIDRVDGFAVSIGPGSYTGLRVGLSLVKGLAYATGKPLATVPTMDAVAYGLPYCRHPVRVLLDARREHVYTAEYRTTHGVPERGSPFRIMTLRTLLDTIAAPTVFVGEGAVVYRAQIRNMLGVSAHFPPDGSGVLRAAPVAFLGLASLRRGESASLYEVEPLYLRRPDFVKQMTRSDIGTTVENAARNA